MKIFNTLADLQAARFASTGQLVQVKGTDTTGDGGIDFFLIQNSGTPDGVDVFATAGSKVAVRQKGAKASLLAGRAKVTDTTQFATGTTTEGVVANDATWLSLVGTTITVETQGFHSGSTVGGAKYKFLNGADSAAEGYVDGINRFQIRGLDVYACLNNENPKVGQLGITPSKTSPTDIYDAIVSGVDFCKPEVITTLSHVSSNWAAGNKYPFAIFGDSTTDGRISTTDGTNQMTVYNISRLVGGDVPDGLVYDHDESEAPNAYVSVLQRMAREFYGQSNLRVYNAGYRGKQVANGWATDNVHNAVYGNTTYSDCKMIGINFGINDSENWDAESLRMRTYQYTKALILDAYLRGVQPFLMTTNAFVGLSDTGVDYGENTEVVQIIDAVKRDLAKEFGLELVDMSSFLYDFVFRNGEGVSSDYAVPDEIHGADLLHMKQAEYFFYKHLSGGLVLKAKDNQLVDVTHPSARWPLSTQWIATSTYTQGKSVLARSFEVTVAFKASAMDDFNYFDLWVWSDEQRQDLFYHGFANRVSDPKDAASTATLPQLKVLSGQFSATNQEVDIYNDVLPTFACAAYGAEIQISIQGFSPFYVGTLRYGLNIIRVGFDSGAAADFDNWVSDNIRIGYFSIKEKTKMSERASYYPPLAVDNLNQTKPWRTAATGLYYAAQDVGLQQNMILPNAHEDMRNLYSLNKVGDSVEIQFKWTADTYYGYVVSALFGTVVTPVSGFDFYKDDAVNGCFVVYANGSGGVSIILVNNPASSSGYTFQQAFPTAVIADVQDKVISIKLSLDTIDQITMSILDSDGSSIDSINLSSDLSRLILSGRVGGLWHNYNLSTTGDLTLDWMRIR